MTPLSMLLVSSLAFSSFDYIGYNASKGSIEYRIAQTSLQIVITYYLWQNANIETAVAFNVAWWFFVDDLLYYAIAESEIFRFSTKWEGRGTFKRVLQSGTRHAWWTPIGLIVGKGNAILSPAIIMQGAFGAGFSIAILLP